MALRAMTYNILVGGDDRIPFIRDVIRSQNPDLVAIQEANRRDLMESLARDLGMNLVFGEANSDFHVALLTRLPVARTRNHRLAELHKTLLEVEVAWEGRPLRVFTTHLKAAPEEEARRVTEVSAILREIGQAGDEARLLLGDLNALSPTDTFVDDGNYPEEEVAFAHRAYALPRLAIPQLLDAGYVDLYRLARPETPGYTAKTPAPVVRIDYLLASPVLARHLISCDRVENPLVLLASDHLPVSADFE